MHGNTGVFLYVTFSRCKHVFLPGVYPGRIAYSKDMHMLSFSRYCKYFSKMVVPVNTPEFFCFQGKIFFCNIFTLLVMLVNVGC
jgi:hypothetical protein